MRIVSVAQCSSYDQAEVDRALDQSLELLGGLEQFVKPGQKVLLKVNALMAAPPEAAVTTHPALVEALVKKIVKLGAIALVGDSAGNATDRIEKVLEVCGIKQAVEQASGKIISFQDSGITEIKGIKISKAVLDADIVINLPKLKTHTWTLYTGAIKNLFGCVPGFHKARYHSLLPRPADFSTMLVDLLEIVKPRLNIMDAVWGMEGSGPSAGRPRLFGALLASADAVALDAVAAQAIGYPPFEIEMIQQAHQRGLGVGELAEIEVVGAKLEEITQKNWRHASSTYSITKHLPEFIYDLARPLIDRLLRVNPKIDQEKCKKCLVCVKSCPAKTINFKKNRVEIDLKGCIMCFCCHELCPYKAIELKRSWLAKLIGIR